MSIDQAKLGSPEFDIETMAAEMETEQVQSPSPSEADDLNTYNLQEDAGSAVAATLATEIVGSPSPTEKQTTDLKANKTRLLKAERKGIRKEVRQYIQGRTSANVTFEQRTSTLLELRKTCLVRLERGGDERTVRTAFPSQQASELVERNWLFREFIEYLTGNTAPPEVREKSVPTEDFHHERSSASEVNEDDPEPTLKPMMKWERKEDDKDHASAEMPETSESGLVEGKATTRGFCDARLAGDLHGDAAPTRKFEFIGGRWISFTMPPARSTTFSAKRKLERAGRDAGNKKVKFEE